VTDLGQVLLVCELPSWGAQLGARTIQYPLGHPDRLTGVGGEGERRWRQGAAEQLSHHRFQVRHPALDPRHLPEDVDLLAHTTPPIRNPASTKSATQLPTVAQTRIVNRSAVVAGIGGMNQRAACRSSIWVVT